MPGNVVRRRSEEELAGRFLGFRAGLEAGRRGRDAGVVLRRARLSAGLTVGRARLRSGP